MENFFMFIVCVALLILFIIMIVKFFDIAKDVRRIAEILEKPNGHRVKSSMSIDDNSETLDEDNAIVDLASIGYTEKDNTIVFDTGMSGVIKKNMGEYVVDTEAGKKFFDHKEHAIEALKKDLHPSGGWGAKPNLKEIGYLEQDNLIIFDTGKQGEVGTNFGVFFITTKKGMQHFNTKEEAINALKRDLHY